MRTVYLLTVLAVLLLAGCEDTFDLDADQGDGTNANNLSSLVIQECRNMPEDRDPIPINGLDFAPGANDPNNQSFTNNCL